MVLSIFISLRINSNFLIWILLELNIISFLPIISSKEHIEIENSIKYFLIQRWASIIFLRRFFFFNLFLNNIYIVIIFRIFIKLGVAPFHIWFISILKTRSLFILIILSTIQKIIPLIILNNLIIKFEILYVIIFLNIIVFLIILSRIININKILAVSSIRNIIWILFRIIFSLKLIFLFIIIYFFLLIGVYIIYNIYNLNIFLQINRINYFDKIILIIIFISLGGIPPLLGFLRKYIILKFLIIYENFFFLLIVIFSSLLILYIYISRIYFFLTNIPSIKINLKINYFFFKKILYILSFIFFSFFFIFQF